MLTLFPQGVPAGELLKPSVKSPARAGKNLSPAADCGMLKGEKPALGAEEEEIT